VTVAALFVLPDGPYVGRADVDAWPEDRDARTYAGPHPVVAHPPCKRWGRYWHGGPSAGVRRLKGDDDGCFAAALAAVRQWGGVLEHPEGSHAWRWFGLRTPPRYGGWVPADLFGGFTCCVEQGHYGHRGRKATWIYACASALPELEWGEAQADILPAAGLAGDELRRAKKTGACQRMSKRERALTPDPFVELLISIAANGRPARRGAVEDVAAREVKRQQRVEAAGREGAA
jgi:hypothetical protein